MTDQTAPDQTAPRVPSLPTSPEVKMAIAGCRRLNNLAIPYEDIEMLRLAQHRATRQATLAEMEQVLRGAGFGLTAFYLAAHVAAGLDGRTE